MCDLCRPVGLGLTRRALLETGAAAKADFETRRGDYRFVSPLPEGSGGPGVVPDRMGKTGGDEAVSPLRDEG